MTKWIMSTGHNGYDLGNSDVLHDSNKDHYSHMDNCVGIQDVFRVMSLYTRLVKEKERLGKKALRNPRTNQELLDRKRWERVYGILARRYEYGIEDVMEQYRYGDFRDEIETVNQRR